MNPMNLGGTPKLRQLLAFLWSRLGTNRKPFLGSVVLSLSDTIGMMIVPLFLEIYFNQLELGQIGYINRLILFMLLVIIFLTGTSIWGHYLKQNTASSLHRDITVELADEAQRLTLQQATATHTADLTQRIQEDSGKSSWIISTVFHTIGNQLFMLLLAIIYMLILQWQISLAIFILMPLGIIGSHLLRHKLTRIGLEINEQQAIVRQCQQDALQGMETIRAFGVENWMQNRFVIEREQLNKLFMRRMWLQQLVNTLSVSLSLLVTWGSILAAAFIAIQGHLQVGALMAIFILVWRVYNPLQNLGKLWGEIQENLGSAARITALWRAEKEPAAAAAIRSHQQNDASQSAVSLSNLSFNYKENAALQTNADKASTEKSNNEESEALLQNISLKLASGTFTAIVGPSGSGKSTIAKLSAGLLLPDEGDIIIHGTDPKLNMEHARQFIAYVPQSPYLFSGTIRDNLLVGNPNASEADMVEAAQVAAAHSFIEALPNGYNTSLKEHGGSLSGGQRQRLAIARALLADRPLIILDEATSALDTDTERIVMEAVIRHVRDHKRTLLIIAHRLTTVQDADRIIVMEAGQIQEEGTHHQLLGKDGLYSKLWAIMKQEIN